MVVAPRDGKNWLSAGRPLMRSRPPVFPFILLLDLLLRADAAAACREDTFSGRIVDARTGAAVAGATVSVPGVSGAVRTDADGRFGWSPRPPLPFQVVVILPGGLVAQPVTVERADGGTVDIRVDPRAEESLTVVGAAPSVSVPPASATTILSSTHLARRSPEHLMQALETVPGVSQVSEGHAAVPAIRGLARGRTLLVIDGARVTAERRVGASATFADPASFDRVDVARGPGSVAYGSDAIGGIISVRTRRAAPGAPLRLRGTATAGAGIPEGRGTLELTKGLRRGGVLVQAHARAASDWNGPGGAGPVLHSGWKDRGFLGRIDHELGPGVLSGTVQSDFGRDIERPRDDSNVLRIYYPFEDSHRVTAAYELPRTAGFGQLALTAFFGTFEQRTDQDRAATPAAGRIIERADVTASDFQVRGNGTRMWGPARVELGVDVNGRYGLRAVDAVVAYTTAGHLVSDRTTLSIDNARRTDVGAYAQADALAAPRLRLAGGLRADSITTRNDGGFFGDRSTSHGAVSGFSAATLDAGAGITLTAQVARGFRDPTLSDRYYRGPTGRGFITGHPELRPETSLQLDLAAHYTRSRTRLAAYFYRYAIADLIERYTAGPDLFLFRNRGRGRVTGFEVEARADLGRGLAVEAGASLGRGHAPEDRAHLDDVGADTVSVGVAKEFARRGYVQARAAFTARDDRPGPSEVATPPATVVDLSGGFHLTANLALRTHVRNLFDAAYPASPDPRWVYAPGRSAALTIAVEY